MLDGATYNPRWTGDPEKYLEKKLAILTDPHGFCIHPTDSEIAKLKTLKTQTQIDNGIWQLIDKYCN